MPFKYVAFEDTDNGLNGDACFRNNKLLIAGLSEVDLIKVVDAPRGFCVDYQNYIPWGAHFGTLEKYDNGAINAFVHDSKTDKIIGFLCFRPLDISEKEVDAQLGRMTGGNE
jgi:hypothetical protein